MRYISYLLIILVLFVSCSSAAEKTEKDFQFDPNIIYQDIANKKIKLLKTYFSAEPIAIDINRCDADTIVLYRKESTDSLDKYYEEIYKLKNEELIRSQKKEIDSLIYSDTRLGTENMLIDLVAKFKNINQVTLNKIEINKDIKIEPILFYFDNQLHTILRILISGEEEIVTIPYGILDKIFYQNYGDKLILTTIVTSPGASSFSQRVKLYVVSEKPGISP